MSTLAPSGSFPGSSPVPETGPDAQPFDAVGSRPKARRIASADEALAAARALAPLLAEGAARRDAERDLPFAEVEAFSQTGLWALQIPPQWGGPGLPTAVVSKVFQIIAAADPSIAQTAQNHYCFVEHIVNLGTETQKRFYLDRVLHGDRLGNGFSESAGKSVREVTTRIVRHGDGYRLSGQKFYSTGALFAHWIPVSAIDENDIPVVTILPADAPGLHVVDDWSGFGQRTTASGTIRLDNVPVRADQLIQTRKAYEVPTAAGPYAQINHAAIDIGIADGALQAAVKFVRGRSRPWIDANVEAASQDPLIITEFGRLFYRLHAAETLLERASNLLDEARVRPGDARAVAEASLAVAEARVAGDEIALEASSRLFELAGSRAALKADNLDRFWRNARVHTLHDPVRWKHFAIGNYYLNSVPPPRHPWI